jgi:hypothetical protein
MVTLVDNVTLADHLKKYGEQLVTNLINSNNFDGKKTILTRIVKDTCSSYYTDHANTIKMLDINDVAKELKEALIKFKSLGYNQIPYFLCTVDKRCIITRTQIMNQKYVFLEYPYEDTDTIWEDDEKNNIVEMDLIRIAGVNGDVVFEHMKGVCEKMSKSATIKKRGVEKSVAKMKRINPLSNAEDEDEIEIDDDEMEIDDDIELEGEDNGVEILFDEDDNEENNEGTEEEDLNVEEEPDDNEDYVDEEKEDDDFELED